MSENSKKNIFKRLQESLKNKTIKPFPEVGETFDFEENDTDLTALLVKKLSALGVNCLIFEKDLELKNSLGELFDNKNIVSARFESPELQHFFSDPLFESDKLMQGNTAAITGCSRLIAKTGTILVDSCQPGGRLFNIAPDIHIVIASTEQIVFNINDALEPVDYNNIPSMLCFISGASRTADIEKTLVMGAHGPKELYVFIKK